MSVAANNKNKKPPKGDINFEIVLNEEQKLVKASIYNKDVTIVTGTWGTGKTLVAVQTALDLFFKSEVNKIILTRPIDFKPTGALPGTIEEKLDIFVMPLKQNMYQTYKNKSKLNEMFSEKIIQILPIDYLRGFTITDAVMVVDEINEMTYEDFKLLITRLGRGSKLIFTGSEEQVINKKNDCIAKIKCLKDCEYVGYHELTANHRNDSIPHILKYIDEQEKKNLINK